MDWRSALYRFRLMPGSMPFTPASGVCPTLGRKIVRIAVIGGGPGGLYFAYLWKKLHPDASIDLFEQNAAGATFGFGVVFSEQALEFLRADDPDTVDAIAPRMESWKNITLNLRGESVAIDGVGFSSIGRLGRRRAAIRYADPVRGSADRLRSDCRCRWPEFAGASHLRKRIRRVGVPFGQSICLVRHHKTVRDTVADLCGNRARRVQRPSLSVLA